MCWGPETLKIHEHEMEVSSGHCYYIFPRVHAGLCLSAEELERRLAGLRFPTKDKWEKFYLLAPECF